jgi:hypothetical protein
MTIINVPADSDVVIRTGAAGESPAYVVSSVVGSGQLACATLASAETLARSYAEHAAVGVWLADVHDKLTFLVAFRGSEQLTPQRSPAGTWHRPLPQPPRTARTELDRTRTH